MILIVTMANHRYTHKSLEEEADLDLRVISYSELFNHQGDRPVATYVFTDFDRLAGFALDRAALLYRELRDQGSVVLNDPALALGRFGLLRALNRAGINMFDAYRVDALEKPTRWPVFLRVEGELSGQRHQPESRLIGFAACCFADSDSDASANNQSVNSGRCF